MPIEQIYKPRDIRGTLERILRDLKEKGADNMRIRQETAFMRQMWSHDPAMLAYLDQIEAKYLENYSTWLMRRFWEELYLRRLLRFRDEYGIRDAWLNTEIRELEALRDAGTPD